MRSFYKDALRLGNVQLESETAIWFADFGTEIQVEKVDSDDAVGVHDALVLHSDDVKRVSEGLRGRGVDVQLRRTSVSADALITDPDGNILMIVPRPAKA